MRAIRQLGLLAPLVLVACATAVTEDLSDDEGSGAHAGTAGLASSGGKASSSGGKSGSVLPAGGGGSGPKAFGGTATSGGNDNEGGEPSGGSGGSSAGSGGKASAGSGGKASGGTAGASGSGGSGSGGTPVGTGSCSNTPLFEVGPSTKYAKGAKVVDVCGGGTPCIRAEPPLETGKSYEFNCLDEYNCGVVDPGTTNWDIPPWSVSKACE